MIAEVDIKNFQSHEMTHMEFARGINTLVGDSDQGKSAALRAILWAVTNTPLGSDYISDWTLDKKGKQSAKSMTSVNLAIVNDGRVDVMRVRTPEFNGYSVYDGGDEDTRYEALRSDVPKEIETTLNLGAVNVQRQMDPPFLVANTPGERARFINQLVNLTDIDAAQSEINSMSRTTAADLRAADDERLRLQNQIDSLSWVDRLKEIVAETEALEKSVNEAKAKSDALASSLVKYSESARTAKALGDILLRAKTALEQAQTVQAKVKDVSRRYNTATTTLQKWNAVPRFGKILDDVANVLASAQELQGQLPRLRDRSRACGRLSEYVEAERIRSRSTFVDQAEAILSRLGRTQRVIDGSLATVKRLSDRLAAFRATAKVEKDAAGQIVDTLEQLRGQACPVCGRPLELHC